MIAKRKSDKKLKNVQRLELPVYQIRGENTPQNAFF